MDKGGGVIVLSNTIVMVHGWNRGRSGVMVQSNTLGTSHTPHAPRMVGVGGAGGILECSSCPDLTEELKSCPGGELFNKTNVNTQYTHTKSIMDHLLFSHNNIVHIDTAKF